MKCQVIKHLIMHGVSFEKCTYMVRSCKLLSGDLCSRFSRQTISSNTQLHLNFDMSCSDRVTKSHLLHQNLSKQTSEIMCLLPLRFSARGGAGGGTGGHFITVTKQRCHFPGNIAYLNIGLG